MWIWYRISRFRYNVYNVYIPRLAGMIWRYYSIERYIQCIVSMSLVWWCNMDTLQYRKIYIRCIYAPRLAGVIWIYQSRERYRYNVYICPSSSWYDTDIVQTALDTMYIVHVPRLAGILWIYQSIERFRYNVSSGWHKVDILQYRTIQVQCNIFVHHLAGIIWIDYNIERHRCNVYMSLVWLEYYGSITVQNDRGTILNICPSSG